MRPAFLLSLFCVWLTGRSQVNLVGNSSFDNASTCPTITGQWQFCSGWSNCNGNTGPGLWGTPDFYHTCGSVGNPNYSPVPPNTAQGYCVPHSGGGMMGLICFNSPYPNYREYLARPLNCPMIAGTTYTVSFWISIGTQPAYKFTTSHFGVCLSTNSLSQSGYAIIPASPQFEITQLITNNAWQQYSFVITPTVTYNHVTLGKFKSDSDSQTSEAFPSSTWPYANWFIDDISVIAPSITGTLNLSTSVSQPSVCGSTGAATISSSGSVAVNWNWMPGNITGSVASGLAPGIYTVTGIAPNGCNTASAATQITISTAPAQFQTDFNINSIKCFGESNGSASMTVSNGTAPYTFTWSSTPSQFSASASGLAAGIYSVQIADANNCQQTVTMQISQPPALSLSVLSSVACKNSPATLSANASGGTPAYSYTWLPLNTNGNTATVIPFAGQIFSLLLSDANSCTVNAAGTVSISTLQANFDFHIDPCKKTCEFQNTSQAGTFYSWSFGDNTSGTQSDPFHVYSPGTYTVTLIAGNQLLCKDTMQRSIAINTVDCNPSIFGLTKAASQPIYENHAYTITFTVTALNNSSLTLSNVTLSDDLSQAFPSPVDFEISQAPTLLSHNSSLAIHPQFNGRDQVNLTNPLFSSMSPGKRDSIVFSVKIKPNKFYGPYYNTVLGKGFYLNNFATADSSNNGFKWDADGDGSAFDDNVPTKIELPPCELFIPDGFSPNGDNINERFFIEGLQCHIINLTVFNRWGSKVYEKQDYDNSWDGRASVNTYFGKDLLPAGTYFYLIEFPEEDISLKRGFLVIQY